MWGMQQTSMAENAAHLAYADGRVYRMTNLSIKTVALDAYSGTIAWLNIYPRVAQLFDPNAPFNLFVNAQSQQQQARPARGRTTLVMVRDGRLFVLPTEGKHLLVYEAGSGVELKRSASATSATPTRCWA